MELTMNFVKIDPIHLYQGGVTLLHVYAQERETKIYVEVGVEKMTALIFTIVCARPEVRPKVGRSLLLGIHGQTELRLYGGGGFGMGG